jgi:diaminopimelate decarboxylase
MELINHTYSIQGLNVTELCQEFGTPLYVYDASKIINQLKSLKNAFSETDVKIKYAAKALTNISVLKLVSSRVPEWMWCRFRKRSWL